MSMMEEVHVEGVYWRTRYQIRGRLRWLGHAARMKKDKVEKNLFVWVADTAQASSLNKLRS